MTTKEQKLELLKNPSKEMLEAAKLTFLCMAQVETIKPVVEDIQRSVLLKHQFRVENRWKETDNGVITDINHAYLMSDEDFKVWHNECRKLEDEKGLKVDNPEFCPLLVAEDDLRKAECLLIDSFEPITGLKSTDFYMLDKRKKMLDLCLKSLAGFMNTKQILAEVMR